MNSVRKKSIVGGIILAAIIGLVAAGAQINPEYTKESSGSEVWQTRIAGPEYDNISTHVHDLGSLEGGTYNIGFVPMGDSPKNLRVEVVGIISGDQNSYFSEKFILERSLVDTGISKYYTWDYVGQKYVQIPESEEEVSYEITIARSGNLKGSVSISLEKVDTSI